MSDFWSQAHQLLLQTYQWSLQEIFDQTGNGGNGQAWYSAQDLFPSHLPRHVGILGTSPLEK
jgi:hypothetical protein